MGDWSAEAVRAAAAAWVWVPPDAQQIVTSEFQLIAYPAHYQHPTQVAWSNPARPVDEVVDEVLAQAAAWGRDRVYWWVRDYAAGHVDAGQGSIETALQARGGRLADTVQVLGYDLTSGGPALDLADGPRAELVQDERTLRASHLVSAEVWEDHRERTPAAIAEEVASVREGLESWSEFRVVVFIGNQPVAAGGCGIVGSVARLWGAGTRPAYRGRGAYRALLDGRVALARDHGATLALVKGRVETSGPILRRAGFTPYGEERSYCVPLKEE
jgi:GNAT superfamily N-acetyltransferase